GIYPDHTHHGNHFIDWAGLRTRTYLTLDVRDFADLLASEALFARKFDAPTSRTLLDLLDTHVHERHVNRPTSGDCCSLFQMEGDRRLQYFSAGSLRTRAR